MVVALGASATARAGDPRSSSVVRSVNGLEPTTTRPASGSFEFREKITSDGREKPAFVIQASGLDASRGSDGRRVAHGAFLLPASGAPEIFLGRLEVSGKGDGRLQKRNATGVLGDNGTPLRAMEGGTLEIRGPDGVVLSNALPAFTLDDADTSTDRRETYGLFVRVSSAAPTGAPGRFTFATDAHATGEIRNRAIIEGSTLAKGSTYGVYIVGPRTVFLGNMENHPNLGATLSLDSRRSPIPGGIVNWAEFNGGTVQIRRGSAVYYTGAITIFRPASEPAEDAGWARSRANVELVASTPLPASAGGNGRALLTASVLTKPRRREQEIRVRAFDLPATGNPYAVVTVEPDGVRHVLGRFDAQGDAGAGGFRITTRRRGSTPPGGVLGQAGRPVELRDVFGTVYLTGTFPTLD